MTDPVDEHLPARLAALTPGRRPSAVPAQRLLGVFDAQAASRHLDLAARELASRGQGFYSIGSAGHESNAAVAAALRVSDPALLHYRSGAFYLQRAAQVPGHDGVRDIALGLVAAAEEPIAGGRHKVFGHADLSIIPQTSTISSHLPRAVGLAFALGRAERLGVAGRWPADSVVVCSFGDASVNHSTAAGAINSAMHSAYQGVPMPLLLVCEDNGIGISARTPPGWVRASFAERAGLPYLYADGADTEQSLRVAAEAAARVRATRRPFFLHLRAVRLMGHAGSDVESAYRSRREILDDYAHDPILATGRCLVDGGACTGEELVRRYERARVRVARTVEEVLDLPKLADRAAVMAPIAAHRPEGIQRAAHADGSATTETSGASEPRLTLAQSINRALGELLEHHPGMLVFGEDVARKGGVYGVTRGLRRRFGGSRVFDTLLDEQSILGAALGAGLHGLLPVPEIQYLAYLHNALDQLRGEAATLGFFSQGQFRNPMVVRVATYGYQKGFGGHFHNDNSVAALRDIPGVVVASPSRPDDAVAMLRTCLAAAEQDGRVCVFLEPIALYHTRDLHRPGDEAWSAPYPAAGDREAHVPIGAGRLHGEGRDLTLVTFGNGLPMSLRTASRLEAEGVGVRVLDLRWLAPLPVADLLEAARATGRVLVVDETRHSGGVSESVVATLVDHGYAGALARVTSADSFIPLGAAASHVLLDEDTIETAARTLLKG